MKSFNISKPFVIGLILVLNFNGYEGGIGFSSAVSDSDSSSLGIISLGKANVHEDAVTLSGFSSGASMATQFHVAHSSLFKGVALFSQVFYRCGPNSLVEFGLRCSKIGLGVFPYNLRKSLKDVVDYESQGLIDPLRNLRNQKIFIWTGDLDEFIPPAMVVQNVDFYRSFLSSPNASIQLRIFNAKHLFPTANYGGRCDEDASENFFLGNCNYSGAYHSLEFLLQDKTNLTYPPENIQLAPLRVYDQSEFYPNGSIRDIGMGSEGFIYIPKGCQGPESKCFLHLNFHGCNEWPPRVAEMYIRNSGFLPVAEVNNIILVFPLSTKIPQNMNGCWDFFSYTGENFATREGSQIKVARAIVERIVRGI